VQRKYLPGPGVGGRGHRGGGVAANVATDARLSLGLRVDVGGEVGGEGGRPVGGAGRVDVDGNVEGLEGADVLQKQYEIQRRASGWSAACCILHMVYGLIARARVERCTRTLVRVRIPLALIPRSGALRSRTERRCTTETMPARSTHTGPCRSRQQDPRMLDLAERRPQDSRAGWAHDGPARHKLGQLHCSSKIFHRMPVCSRRAALAHAGRRGNTADTWNMVLLRVGITGFRSQK
jgi:hypothetical protein